MSLTLRGGLIMSRGMRTFLGIPILLIAVIYLASCAVPPPTSELTAAEQSIAKAKSDGAAVCAPEELAAAEEALARGKKIMQEFCSELEARRMLVDARANAELAIKKCIKPPPPPPVVEPEPVEVSLKDIFFDYDKSDIRPDAAEVLKENAKLLNDNPNISVIIEGYADIRGNAAYNLRLAQDRADSARAFLTSLGVDGSRLTATSGGETEQFAAGSTEDSYQLNRRAHFVLPDQTSSIGARLIFVVNK